MITINPPLVLASGSAQRQAILQGLGLEFISVPADIDESAIQHPDHLIRVVEVAKAKAQKVVTEYPDHLVLAADTYVLNAEKSFEKPVDREQARQMLMELSGKTCREITGICLIDPVVQTIDTKVCEVSFTFRSLSQIEVNQYVTTQPVTDWSAAFSPAYPAGAALIASVKGSLTGFTHGLPVEWLMELLTKRNYI